METNEQAKNEQFVKESLILKGIANNLLSMQFPKFKNLIEMLQYFDYEVKITPKLFESENSVVAFFQKHNQIKSTVCEFEFK
jgi:N-acetyl-anhydromuramyl-L-alanine amidase AmpD